MDQVFIDKLTTYGILGIHPHEQRLPQKICISVKVTTDIGQAAKSDDINKTINYSTLSKSISKFIDANHYLTIEALIEALSIEIMADERIVSVWLRIEKPNAVPKAESVGVEITRSRYT